MKQSLELIDQLIQMEEAREIEHKELMHKIGKSCRTVGDSSMLFHLKTLKELVQKESDDWQAYKNAMSIFGPPPIPSEWHKPHNGPIVGGDLTPLMTKVTDMDGGGQTLDFPDDEPQLPPARILYKDFLENDNSRSR